MTWLLDLIVGQVLPNFWPYILAAVGAVVGAFGIYRKGRKDQRSANDRADLKTHERMNDAETGDGMSDDQRREWLRRFGRRNGH